MFAAMRELDCIVAFAPRNDGTNNRALATHLARAMPETSALEEERARGMPGAQCTRSLVRAYVVEYATPSPEVMKLGNVAK